jgi:ferritin-like metal-binding protein YciE
MSASTRCEFRVPINNNMEIPRQKFESLRDLYVNELRNLFSAETQLVESLPKMADGATTPALKQAFTDHLGETRMHVERLEHIFKDLSEEATGEICEAMRALIKEADRYIKAEGDDDIRDAGLIGAAQRIEHYEIAAYGTARALAFRLSETGSADSLEKILNEEGAVDHKLTTIAEGSVNVNAGSPAKTKSEFDVSIF